MDDPGAKRGVGPATAGKCTMTDPTNFPIYRSGMTFKHFIPAFNVWFAQGGRVANLVGIRADESAQQFSRHQLPAQAASVAGAAV